MAGLAPDRRTNRAASTEPRRDLITILFGTWMMIGVFLDGYAHANIIEEIESFFTPWHAVFYSGFLATAGWITWNVYRRLSEFANVRDAVPQGYGYSVIGIGVFALGGVGDAVWHTISGIEVGIDALLSPTHLLLFVGILFILTTPFRTAAIANKTSELTGLNAFSVSLSAGLTTSLLAFFFFYLWAPAHPFWAEQGFDPATGDGEIFVALGMAAILLTTLILLAPLAAVLVRWRPPIGMTTIGWGAVSTSTAVAVDLDVALAASVGLAAGLAADAVMFGFGAGPESGIGSLLTMTIAPLVAWSVYFLLIAVNGDLAWHPEVWGGAIVFSVLTGAGLAKMTLPQARSGDRLGAAAVGERAR